MYWTPKQRQKYLKTTWLETMFGKSASTIVVPPFDIGNNVWAFDPDGVGAAQYVAGPTGTITAPTKTQGTPSFYTFGATDRIDFGNALESTWNASPNAIFTIYACVNPSSADLAAGARAIVSKDNGSTQREFVMYLSTGAPSLAAFVTLNGSSGAVLGGASGAITAARHVIAMTVDGSASSGSRLKVYVDGSVVAMTAETGAGGTMAASTATLRIGERSDAVAGPAVQSYAYAYNGAHSAGTVSSITTWLQTTKGWV